MNNFCNKEKIPHILIYDSGVGGLSVYQEIKQLLPNANYLYVFDNAGFPYGEKTESFIIDRVMRLLSAINERYTIMLIVIACNTASTVVLPTLRTNFSFPIVGVVPAIKPAVAITKNKVIGLIATKATITRAYTRDLIESFASDCKVELLGSSHLVELAEQKLRGNAVDLDELSAIFTPWLQMKVMPDTVVLGCTHFPLLLDELVEILPKGINFIDSGSAIAKRVVALMPKIRTEIMTSNHIAICTHIDNDANILKMMLEKYHINTLIEYAI